MWPFKWKLSACTFTWCYLFVKILENEIWKFGQNLPLATFGSERVKRRQIWLTSLRSTVTEKLFSSSDTSDAFDPLWMPFTISTVLPENPFTSFASKHFVTSCDTLLLSRFHRKINWYTFLQYILQSIVCWYLKKIVTQVTLWPVLTHKLSWSESTLYNGPGITLKISLPL